LRGHEAKSAQGCKADLSTAFGSVGWGCEKLAQDDEGAWKMPQTGNLDESLAKMFNFDEQIDRY
jgi:hypothetical protein